MQYYTFNYFSQATGEIAVVRAQDVKEAEKNQDPDPEIGANEFDLKTRNVAPVMTNTADTEPVLKTDTGDLETETVAGPTDLGVGLEIARGGDLALKV